MDAWAEDRNNRSGARCDGDIDGEDTRAFLDHTRCSYFMKPFNLERLTAAVDMLTGTRTPDTIG